MDGQYFGGVVGNGVVDTVASTGIVEVVVVVVVGMGVVVVVVVVTKMDLLAID